MTTGRGATWRVRRGGRRRAAWGWARLLGGAGILGAVVWSVGTGPFVDAVHRVDGASVAAAAGLGVVTTLCCAWRWSVVASGLGVGIPLRAAVPAYYRSQFLNTTLPGGVLGDVHRAVRHGRDAGDRSLALRAVVWERCAGQVVQVALTCAVLLLLPSPVRSAIPVVGATVLVAAVVAAAVLAGAVLAAGIGIPARIRRGTTRWGRAARAAAADLRGGLLPRRAWPQIVLASAVVVAGHAATFVIAARASGTSAPVAELLPLGVLVLLAMSIPANVAGWGPREGAAAWVFGAAGLGADRGVTAAVVYGVLVLAATAPGAVVLVASRARPAPPAGSAGSAGSAALAAGPPARPEAVARG